MNSYVGIDFLPSCPTAFVCRVKRTRIWRFLGTYRCRVTSLRILARSNLRDSISFLIAQPPLHRPTDQELRQGEHAHTSAPDHHPRGPRGIKLLCAHHGPPRAG